ncbi:MAG: cytochrome c oxidase subunit II [Bacteroidetes bacterium]|nr:MAG: cytochrome c oxidase subunit II [Bacteroidota bacterium]TNF00538.1 MAG: cytochrome c oxidase subunit II [Bacteroidota bacterium]
MVTKLIILLVIVLGVVAIAQMMRVYELSSKITKKNEHEISNRDNRLNAKLMLTFMIVFFVSVVYLILHYGWVGRGTAASVHGRDIDWLMNLNLIIIFAVFFLTNALLYIFAFKYVKKPGVPALYYPHNNKLEMLWTVVPAMVLAVIIILGLKTWNEATDEASAESIRIELFSKQFDWTARYAGKDNVLGKFDYKLTLDNNELALKTTATIDSAIRMMEEGPMGIKTLEAKLNDRNIILVPEERAKMEADLSRKERLIRLLYQMKQKHDTKDDASAWDDFIQKDTLYLCKGKEVEFNFRSKDVIHSAFFPHFRAQMNTVPGLTTRFKFTPDVSTAEMREIKGDDKFNYVLLCNKICGGAHYKMKMMVVVLEEDDYNNWVKGKMTKTFRDTYFPVMEEVATPEAPAEEVAEGGEEQENV